MKFSENRFSENPVSVKIEHCTLSFEFDKIENAMRTRYFFIFSKYSDESQQESQYQDGAKREVVGNDEEFHNQRC